MGYTYAKQGCEWDLTFLTHWADFYLEISLCHNDQKRKINMELKMHLISPKQTKPQTGDINNVWLCSVPLMLHLLVLLM